MTVSYNKRPADDLAHLAWCLLVALRLAQQEGRAVTALQQHLFIMNWLSTAQKRKLFPKTVARDILWLLTQGRQHGSDARLVRKVDFIWRTSRNILEQQSALFRFAYFTETLKSAGWQDYLLSETEWVAYSRKETVRQAIYTPQAQLPLSFSELGELTAPLELRLTGDTEGILPLLTQYCLRAEQRPDEQGFHILMLMPDHT
ncbi:TPA: DUF2913 family protein [Klebsiella oxytoca]|uniref:DUF2913 family protein n=1 Tax=Klebsiella oxytoca TaxID=571 RepID=A0AAN5RDF9_KLEOX|nr:DUF2913 family protein [Klebsiella oxytoca]